MPYYLGQGSYTSEAIAGLTRTLENREEVTRALVEQLGGRLVQFFFAQGEYDLVVILEFPDAETANVFALAAAKTGHLRVTKTTPLFTTEETMRAMRRAGELTVRAPGA